MRIIDLNADLGEGYGPWRMGEDAAMLDIVTSANVACGGHAGDPETMFATLRLAADRGVSVGAHPGYADRQGFGRRIIPMAPQEITRLIAAQVGALQAIARLAGTAVRYVKPHGALANLAAESAPVAQAVVEAVAAVCEAPLILALSGSALEQAAVAAGIPVRAEVYADRGYLPDGRLMPRSHAGAVLHDPAAVADRLLGFLETGRMPAAGGHSLALAADSVCLHGDTPGAVAMARHLRDRLAAEGVRLAPFAAG